MEYDLRIIEQPTIPADWLGKAKHQCRTELDETYDDDFLLELLVEAHAYVIHRADITLLPTRHRLTLPRFPRSVVHSIYLPRGPLVTVDGIQYDDANGQQQVANVSSFTVGLEVSRLAVGGTDPWPSTRCVPGSVRIDYTAGHADPTQRRPEALRAIKLLVGHWYRFREDGIEMAIQNIPHGVEEIIDILRPGDDFMKPIRDGRD